MTNVTLSRIRVTGYSGPLISTENVKGSGLDLTAEVVKRLDSAAKPATAPKQ